MSNRLPLRDRMRDHPMMAGVEPEEDPFCEVCGWSIPMCECPDPEDGRSDWEYERKRDREMEAEWERAEKERGE